MGSVIKIKNFWWLQLDTSIYYHETAVEVYVCLICHNLRKNRWSLDACTEALLFHWNEFTVEHREGMWLWIYDRCIIEHRYDLIKKLVLV